MTDTTTTLPPTDTDTETDTESATPAPDSAPAPDKPLFTDFGVDADLADALRKRGIIHPFAIQELSLPLGLKGHDLIGQARTGTGKTLGFGLPLLQRIDPTKAQTQAMVIVPTRELCIQVAEDLTIGAGRGITSIAVYGGVGYEEQIEALTTGVHVVVGTPGRTLDHLGRGNLDVSNIHTVVLDEADEMLDMGFLPDVEKLLVDVPTDRQTLLFSATMPTAIVKLARRFMDKPTFMRADDTLHETAPTVEQHFFLVHRMDKPRVLARLLQMPGRGGSFVFCRTKRMCDRLVRELEPLGVSAIAVHGDLRQSTRERNLDRFRSGKADVLVATEVAARGLDVSNASHVVNYDCPHDEKMYLHRIGRTARAGESGVAITFAEFNEVDRVNVIRKRVGVEGELTEVFSTSDVLTELFDLPETTPWDDLGKSDDSSRSLGRRSSGQRSSRSTAHGGNGGSSDRRGRSSASSSGSNRSSGRGTDRRGASDNSRGRASSRSGGSDADTGSGSDQARSGRDSGRSRTRTRSRTRNDRRRSGSDNDRTQRSSRDRAASRASDTSPDTSPTTSTDRSRHEAEDDTRDQHRGGKDDRDANRPSGGARKRARRNRRSRSSGRGSGRGSTESSNGSSKGSRSDERGADKQQADRDSRDSSGNRNRSRGSGAKGRGGSSDRAASRSTSGGRTRGDSSRGAGGQRDDEPPTTRRGDDARGAGTPRLDRRVDVEHLP